MEDFEAQEIEFWAKLSEESISRSQMLRRSAAAAFGLTVLAAPASALAARTRLGATTPAAPASGMGLSMSELVSEAKKEGHLNTIALPPDWANYGEIMSTFQKKYGIKVKNAATRTDSSAEENQAVVSLKGRLAGTGRRRRRPGVRDPGRPAGALRPLQGPDLVDDPAQPEGPQRPVDRRLLGRDLDRVQREARQARRRPSWQDLLKPEYKGQVCLEREPADVGRGGRRRVRRRARQRRLGQQRPARHRLLREAEVGRATTGPGQSTPQTVASGQTPISIDWDYLNLGVRKEFPAAHWKSIDPERRRLRRLLLPGRSTRPLRTRGRPGSGRSSSTPTRDS